MIIKQTTTVMFHIPDEKELHEKFLESHDISQWDAHHTGVFLVYSHVEEFMVHQSELRGET